MFKFVFKYIYLKTNYLYKTNIMEKQIDIIEQPIEKKKRGRKPKLKTADVIIEKRNQAKHLHPMDQF